ncbi:hypothetical protein B7463_g2950, partial [Scytalidium lignicola]
MPPRCSSSSSSSAPTSSTAHASTAPSSSSSSSPPPATGPTTASSTSPSTASAAASEKIIIGSSGNTTADGDFNYTNEYLSMVLGTFNQTAVSIAGSAIDEAKRRVASSKPEWTGIGVEWLRSLLGKREWRVPCVDVYIRL